VRGLLSFFTVFPARAATLEETARSVHLLPLVGLVAGLPGAALALSGYLLPAGVAAALALGAVLLAAGLHHADGLLDVGDALMVRGSPARRREVLKDLRVGAGALAAAFLVYAPAVAALASLVERSPISAALALLAGEAAARSAMLCLLSFGEAAERTSSAAPFTAALKDRRRRHAGLALALALPALVAIPSGAPAPILALLWLPAAGLSLAVARRAFGGIGGDVCGASGELARTLVLVGLSAGGA
jgi:adenosylcobinamide-GDP ribazoletransferase